MSDMNELLWPSQPTEWLGQWQQAGSEPAQTVSAAPTEPQSNGWFDMGAYKEQLSSLGEWHIQNVSQQLNQIETLLSDPAQMESLTKQDLQELYKARDAFRAEVDRYRDILEQKQNAEIDSQLTQIENPKVREYIGSLKSEFTPDELPWVIEFANQILKIAWQTAAPTTQTGWNEPAAIAKWNTPAQDGWAWFDPVASLLSTDPNVRQQWVGAMEDFLKWMSL